jgi:hypothetical protein
MITLLRIILLYNKRPRLDYICIYVISPKLATQKIIMVNANEVIIFCFILIIKNNDVNRSNVYTKVNEIKYEAIDFDIFFVSRFIDKNNTKIDRRNRTLNSHVSRKNTRYHKKNWNKWEAAISRLVVSQQQYYWYLYMKFIKYMSIIYFIDMFFFWIEDNIITAKFDLIEIWRTMFGYIKQFIQKAHLKSWLKIRYTDKLIDIYLSALTVMTLKAMLYPIS